MAFSSNSLYDIPGFAPNVNVLLISQSDFAISYSNKDTSWDASNRHSVSSMVDIEIFN